MSTCTPLCFCLPSDQSLVHPARPFLFLAFTFSSPNLHGLLAVSDKRRSITSHLTHICMRKTVPSFPCMTSQTFWIKITLVCTVYLIPFFLKKRKYFANFSGADLLPRSYSLTMQKLTILLFLTFIGRGGTPQVSHYLY